MESLDSAVVASADSVQRKRRQQRCVAEKRRIIEETMAPGASVALVARAHGVNVNQLFAWRRLYRAGRLTSKRSKAIDPNVARLLPVSVSEDGRKPEIVVSADAATMRAQTSCPDSTNAPAGIIHIQFHRAQVRVEGSADPAALRIVLEHLSR